MLSVANLVIDPGSHSPEDTSMRIVRNPESFIESVHEECRIEDWGVDVTTQIRFKAEHLKNVEWFYLRIQDPEKGEIDTHEILTPNVTTVVHDDHMRLAKTCIENFLSALILSIRYKEGVDSRRRSEILGGIFDASMKLIHILEESPECANRTLQSLIDEKSQRFNFLPESHEANYSKDAAEKLSEFCDRYSQKYMSLVRIQGGDNLPKVVKFRSRKEFDVMRKRVGYSDSEHYDTKLGWIGAKKDAAKYSTFAAFPPDIRMHLWWAKRTPHYTLSVHAPDGKFFSGTSSKMSTRKNDRQLYYLAPQDDNISFRWSLSQKREVRIQANLYVGNATKWPQPLYFHATHYEIPGRSILRMIGLTALAAAMMTIMWIGGVDTTKHISAMLAVLALGLAVSPFNKDEGFATIPLLSRITPAAVFISLCLYIAWGLTGKTNHYWLKLGWLPPIVIVSLLCLVHSWRAIRIAIDFCREAKILSGGIYTPLAR
jgi:hypothetical protein